MLHVKIFLVHVHTDCKAKGNGQFVKCWESGGAEKSVGLETTAEIKASHRKKGGFKITPSTVVRMIDVFL